MDNFDNNNRDGRASGSSNGYHAKKFRNPKGGSSNKSGNFKFPDRWTKYAPFGQLMPDTRFIAFKTPLSNQFFDGKDDIPFMIPDIVREVEKTGKKLGLVIDLTATTRYYESSEWANHDVRYEKLFCQGHTVHQQQPLVDKFIKIVDKYLRQHKDDNSLIGVHCTHGINRTGYLICRYLMQKKGWEAGKAIASFESSRGTKIERSEYITDLHNYKSSGSKSRRSSSEAFSNDTTWRNSSSSWRTSDASSSWRPRSGSDSLGHQAASSRYPQATSRYQSNHHDSWLPARQVHSIEDRQCQEATAQLRGLFNIGEKKYSKYR